MKYNPWAFGRFLPDGYDGEFVWDYLTEVWGREIEPMDFDCVVEKGGEFLVFETKWGYGRLEWGQERTFRWILENPKWTLIVLYGKTPGEVEELFIYNRRALVKHIKPATSDDVKRECANWANRRISRDVNRSLRIGRS